MRYAEAQVTLFTPPAVSGLGGASGFKIIIEDRGDLGVKELQKQIERLMARGQRRTLQAVREIACGAAA